MGVSVHLQTSNVNFPKTFTLAFARITISVPAMEDDHEFNIEKVSAIWIVTGLCIVPLGLYFMLNLLSPLMHRFTAMKISEVFSHASIMNELY